MSSYFSKRRVEWRSIRVARANRRISKLLATNTRLSLDPISNTLPIAYDVLNALSMVAIARNNLLGWSERGMNS